MGSPPPGAVRSVRWTRRAQRRALGLEGWTTGLHWARLLRTGSGRARSCPCSLSSLTGDRTPPRKEEPRCGGSKVAHSAQQGCGAGRGGRVPAPRQSPGPALTRPRVCHGADSRTLPAGPSAPCPHARAGEEDGKDLHSDHWVLREGNASTPCGTRSRVSGAERSAGRSLGVPGARLRPLLLSRAGGAVRPQMTVPGRTLLVT